jgi:hypothetical protein
MSLSEKEQVHLKNPFSHSFFFDPRRFCLIDHTPPFRDQLICPRIVARTVQLGVTASVDRLVSAYLGSLYAATNDKCQFGGQEWALGECYF